MSMENEMSTSEARQEIAKGFRMYKAFEKAGDALAVLDQLEASIKEKTKIHYGLQSDLENLALEKKETVTFISETKRKAAQDSRDCLNEAQKEHEKIVTEARATSEQLISAAKKEVYEHGQKKSQLINEYTEYVSLIEQKKTELAKMQSAIDAHKADLSKFLKG